MQTIGASTIVKDDNAHSPGCGRTIRRRELDLRLYETARGSRKASYTENHLCANYGVAMAVHPNPENFAHSAKDTHGEAAGIGPVWARDSQILQRNPPTSRLRVNSEGKGRNKDLRRVWSLVREEPIYPVGEKASLIFQVAKTSLPRSLFR